MLANKAYIVFPDFKKPVEVLTNLETAYYFKKLKNHYLAVMQTHFLNLITTSLQQGLQF